MTLAKAGRSKFAKARKMLTADQLFFYEHAGYSYNPQTETPEQGRMRGAIELAQAEQYAANLGWTIEWDWDEIVDRRKNSKSHPRKEHEVLCARSPDPSNPRYSLAALCGIDHPDSNYRRVVEAELASEALHDRETETR